MRVKLEGEGFCKVTAFPKQAVSYWRTVSDPDKKILLVVILTCSPRLHWPQSSKTNMTNGGSHEPCMMERVRLLQRTVI